MFFYYVIPSVNIIQLCLILPLFTRLYLVAPPYILEIIVN